MSNGTQRLGTEHQVMVMIDRLSLETGVDHEIYLVTRLHSQNPKTELHVVNNVPQREQMR